MIQGTARRALRKAAAMQRWLWPSPDAAAWKRAWHQAELTPRFTPGRIQMRDYDLQYSDLLTLCVQWQDIFVKRCLDFAAATDAPRILDCGANVGLASLYFKRRYPRARITAYEADPALAAIAAGNLRRNGAQDAEPVHAAVWTTAGELTFCCEGSDSGMIASLPGAIDGRAAVVPSVRLRDLLEAEPIDLLKLDIEGAEDPVLADCEPQLHRVRALILDLHEFDAGDRRAPGVLARLSAAGFTYAIDEFVPLPWREPLAGGGTPFPGKALQWSMTVRAWRTAA
ncbi:MAG: methyltransferase FkbM family [Acidobacteria bacterium]|nr:methyltransferase FkbM family [Acidobacteriota bacterium]